MSASGNNRDYDDESIESGTKGNEQKTTTSFVTKVINLISLLLAKGIWTDDQERDPAEEGVREEEDIIEQISRSDLETNNVVDRFFLF